MNLSIPNRAPRRLERVPQASSRPFVGASRHKSTFIALISIISQQETPMQSMENMRWTRTGWTPKVNLLASEAHGHPLHAPGENWRNETMDCFP